LTGSFYRHLGITVRCERALPALPPTSDDGAEVTVVVQEGAFAELSGQQWDLVPGQRTVSRCVEGGLSWLRLRYELLGDWADFVVDPAGATVWCGLSRDEVWPDAAELLIGPVFSCLMAKRGCTCLHASAVELDGRAIGIIGPSGSGKSTMSLALARRGAMVVSDDVVLLCGVDGQPAVARGLPRLRVHASSALLVTDDFVSLDPVWPHEVLPTKRYLDLSRSAPAPAAGPVPLAALYFVVPMQEWKGEPVVRPLDIAEALPRLMTNRHHLEALDEANDRRDFPLLARLAVSARIGALERPAGLAHLDRTVDALLADVGAAA
jgi:hypothetical protein